MSRLGGGPGDGATASVCPRSELGTERKTEGILYDAPASVLSRGEFFQFCSFLSLSASTTKLVPKRLGTAALDNACIQLQGLVRGIDEAPEKRHQGDGRETQRGMSVTEPAGGVSKRKWSGCEVVPVEKRMQIRSFWLLFNQQFKQHGRIGP